MQYQISLLRELIYRATDQGANFLELCKRLNVTPDQLNHGEGMMDFKPGESPNFWAEAVDMTGDNLLGLHLGQRESPNNPFGMLGLLANSCRTMGEAIQVIIQYNDTISTVFRYSLDTSGENARFLFEPIAIWEANSPESARQAVDMSLSGFTKAFYLATDKKAIPVAAELKYAERDLAEYEKIIRAPITFNRRSNCLVFKKSDLRLALISHDESLYVLFDSLLRQKQVLLNEQKTLAQKIRQLLIFNFKGLAPQVDIIASHLNMTARTLQRKLSDENTSYRDITNQLRKELAQELLKTGGSKKGDIAAILGYTDPSTFRKAMKTWEIA